MGGVENQNLARKRKIKSRSIQHQTRTERTKKERTAQTGRHDHDMEDEQVTSNDGRETAARKEARKEGTEKDEKPKVFQNRTAAGFGSIRLLQLFDGAMTD